MSDSSGSQDLSVQPLSLTREQRLEFDRDMFENISGIPGNPMTWTDRLLAIFINTVISYPRDYLKDKDVMKSMSTTAISQTLQQHPKLREMVRKMCQTGKLSEIADFKIFQIPQASRINMPLVHSQDKEFLYNSFYRPYLGKAVDGFYEYLKDNNIKFKGVGAHMPYYAKFCSIVQSSGTGKSRLLTELRKKGVVVLYMNLREPSDDGFPERDPIPARILTEKTDCAQTEYTTHCCALFTAIFRALTKELGSKPSLPPGDPITSWNDKMCDVRSKARTKFFQTVESLYEKILNEIKLKTLERNADTDRAVQTVQQTVVESDSLYSDLEESQQTNDASSSAAASQSRQSPASKKRKISNEKAEPSGSKNDVPAPKLEGESFVKEAYAEMLTAMSGVFTEQDEDYPKLVISVDEAHSLTKTSSNGFRPSHILGRVINCYSEGEDTSVWVVFASTTPHVVDFLAPPVIRKHPFFVVRFQSSHNPADDSQRVAVGGHLLFQPYTHLGWDQHADRLSDIPANDAGKFKHIVRFGRPLWKSLVDTRNIGDILKSAAHKLLKSTFFDPSDTNQALAVLSQRFGLDICFGHPDAVSYVEKGVASHLRICFSTTQDRSWTYTGYPSEPLLSCVAADLLHSGTTTSLEGALGVLKEKVDGGMVNIGQSGELVSRLVLLLAKDMYVRGHLSEGTIHHLRYKGSGDAELMDCQKVSVLDFLRYLFGKEFWPLRANTAFRHAYINFSHWVSMSELISPGAEDPEQPTFELLSAEEWTLRHWVRTSAVQCCHLQPLVDKMIPIYFDDPTLGSDDVQRVSQIFISDKAGKNPNARDLGVMMRKHDSIKCLSALPYIAILLDFGVGSRVTATFPERDPNHAETDQCLRIYAAGMNDTTFPFLSKTIVASQLRGLISREEAPTQTNLDALVKFGSTARLRNLQWEKQD
ncbi:hypothetical protein DEU56DRAFT_984909 [Suillus clintonianus]|uniref:uncharacterized protein n=1 Tax=Suillus clintonianus TaxID=1904413 RepID=UPI001B87D99D|nr:uncharacterized protein DEU56DRAFT_984909 [Suillus clintonianus]KAG2116779.1 hypothetical protein DEU56DRAFT_984909 [Suillus clintonianus]